MDEERELILQAYRSQCDETLGQMEEALLALESHASLSTDPQEDEEAAELVHTVFRICHTIKGDSDILGFAHVARLAHALEDLLDALRSGALRPSVELISLLLEGCDALRDATEHVGEGRDPDEGPRYDELADRLRRRIADESTISSPNVQGGDPQSAPTEPASDGDASAHDDDASGQSAQSIRVRVDTLDRLVNLTGELAIGRSRVTQLLNRGDLQNLSELRESHQVLDRLYAQLQEEVMRVRMVPIGPVFRQHLRTVRNVALSETKRARLEVSGDDVELDNAVIEHLRECLGHLVRNAITHGIELPAERERLGKPASGCVSLRAAHEGANIVVTIADDGAGLDHAAILTRARATGLLEAQDQPGRAQIEALIFEPGFSTASDTTLHSGRGVGMDVVRRKIETLGGSVSLESVAGQGTTIVLRLPLTLAIVEGFAVGVGREVYVMPLASVVECLDAGEASARRAGRGILDLRGKPLPYVRLRDVLGGTDLPAERESIVVVRHGNSEAGLAVDRLYGESQAVIKPLGPMFRELPGISGATILGDGEVALILDVPSLLRTAAQGGGKIPPSGPGVAGGPDDPNEFAASVTP